MKDIASLFRPGDAPTVADYTLFDTLTDEQQRAAAVVLANELANGLEAVDTLLEERNAKQYDEADAARADVLAAKEVLDGIGAELDCQLFEPIRTKLDLALKHLGTAEEHLDKALDE